MGAGRSSVDVAVGSDDDFGAGVEVEVAGMGLTVDGDGVDVDAPTACAYPFDGVILRCAFVAFVDGAQFGDVLFVSTEFGDLLLSFVALLLFALCCVLVDELCDWSSEEVCGQLSVVPVADRHERVCSLRVHLKTRRVSACDGQKQASSW